MRKILSERENTSDQVRNIMTTDPSSTDDYFPEANYFPTSKELTRIKRIEIHKTGQRWSLGIVSLSFCERTSYDEFPVLLLNI